MVVPGISGSFLLLLLGSYASVISAINDVNIAVLAPFAVGVLLGIVAVTHGIRYAFPARPGPLKRGTPAAMSAPIGEDLFAQSGRGPGYVWPNPDGGVRGQVVDPLHDEVPHLVESRPDLYEWLALVDIIRIGSAREREVAAEVFSERIMN